MADQVISSTVVRVDLIQISEARYSVRTFVNGCHDAQYGVGSESWAEALCKELIQADRLKPETKVEPIFIEQNQLSDNKGLSRVELQAKLKRLEAELLKHKAAATSGIARELHLAKSNHASLRSKEILKLKNSLFDPECLICCLEGAKACSVHGAVDVVNGITEEPPLFGVGVTKDLACFHDLNTVDIQE
ncbi:hypothetical protein Sps_05148 [Shewanella psychrophila]|uniref:Uncharacterized protein n=1 Tax=Shewanella psychrophila TaxID=225848 RepID=A0A1S6HXB7_9GAMM|nr:hypothetical protein [Shewanella psychrophila]AQS40217.1 hypothetical protein Sps_05148 [Shewanella psychrophila]